ncbi:hypothetical protein [Loktanella sp. R86503]|uniref:hypothetical protein n=1 Tax=Loktanella sp. R86503 TaxID=3093847 RepID=UPI0036DDBEAF
MARARKAGKRTKSGQLSRAKDEVDRRTFEESDTQTVLKARRRHRREFTQPADAEAWRKKDAAPVTKAQATLHKLDARGSILGILWAEGKITAQEREAGQDYCQRYIKYASTNGLPRPTVQGCAYGEVRGNSRPDNIRAAIAAKEAHRVDQNILRKCSSGVIPAIMRACVREEKAPLHQIKEGLQALVQEGR